MTKIVPIRSKNVAIQEKFGVIENKELDIALKYESWNHTPGEISHYFTTFYLIFRNRTDKSRDIKPESFALIGEDGEQYDLYSSDDVVQFMYGDESIENLNYLLTLPLNSDEEKNILEKQIDSRINGIRNIQSKAFSFKKIRPQSQKSGYIFFEKMEIRENSRFKIFYKKFNIEFVTKQ